jgi:hypothetical protein
MTREAVDATGGGGGGAGAGSAASALRAERLDYIAEIARELQAMADQAGCPTLAGLLELACREARQRRRD